MASIPEVKLEVVSTTYLTANILEIVFTKENLLWNVGQFVNVRIPEQFFVNDISNYQSLANWKSGRPIYRAYSIASHPSDEYIVLVVKILSDGVGTQYLASLQNGDNIFATGAFGVFTLAESEVATPVFVATGTGIAPMLPMIRELLEVKKYTGKIYLIFGVRFQEDIFWDLELSALAKKYPQLNYCLSLTRANDNWNGYTGRVVEHLNDIDFSSSQFYFCGSGAMIEEMRDILSEKSVSRDMAHFEKFN